MRGGETRGGIPVWVGVKGSDSELVDGSTR
jgi:hypothetical protein